MSGLFITMEGADGAGKSTQIEKLKDYLSNKGYVLIRGQKAKIIGRVCMDQFMVDVTDIDGVCEGDDVTLIGEDGKLQITVEELAELAGTFNYEFVCDLGKRVPRVFYSNGRIICGKDYFDDNYDVK